MAYLDDTAETEPSPPAEELESIAAANPYPGPKRSSVIRGEDLRLRGIAAYTTPPAPPVSPMPSVRAPYVPGAQPDYASPVPSPVRGERMEGYAPRAAQWQQDQAKQAAAQERADAAAQKEQERQFRMEQTAVEKRLRAQAVPSYLDAGGAVQPVTDEIGAPLQYHDRTHGIAYDSAGNARAVDGAGNIGDPYEHAPLATDETGRIYKAPKGLPWRETDASDPSEVAKYEDKLDAHAETLLSAQAVVAHKAAAVAAARAKASAKAAETSLGALGVPPVTADGAKVTDLDPGTARQHLEDSFNGQYAAPEANRPPVFGGGRYTPEAQALRDDITARKAKALSVVGAHQQALGALSEARAVHGDIQTQREEIAGRRLERLNAQRTAAGLPEIGGAIPGLDATVAPDETDAIPGLNAAAPAIPRMESETDGAVDHAEVAKSLPPFARQALSPAKVDAKGQVEPEGFWATAGRAFGSKIIPAIGTAASGLAAGTLAIPSGPGAVAADIAAGAAGGVATAAAQRSVMGERWAAENDAQMQANERAHPVAAQIGTILPFLVSLFGGGGALVKVGKNVVGKAVTQGGKEAVLEAVAEAAQYEAPLAERLATHAAMGARAGASEGAQEKYVEGKDVSVTDRAAKSAVQFGAMGLFPAAKTILGSVFGKAVTDAAAMTFAGDLYDAGVHGKPFDLEETAKQFAGDVPAFVIQNALLGFFHYGMSNRERGLTPSDSSEPGDTPDVAAELRELRKTDPEKYKQRRDEEIAKRQQGEYAVKPDTFAERLAKIDIRLAQMRGAPYDHAEERAGLEAERDSISADQAKEPAAASEPPPQQSPPPEGTQSTAKTGEVSSSSSSAIKGVEPGQSATAPLASQEKPDLVAERAELAAKLAHPPASQMEAQMRKVEENRLREIDAELAQTLPKAAAGPTGQSNVSESDLSEKPAVAAQSQKPTLSTSSIPVEASSAISTTSTLDAQPNPAKPSAETGETPPSREATAEAPTAARAASPHDFTPALVIGGETVAGKPGQSHLDIYNDYMREHGGSEARHEAAVEALNDDAAHVPGLDTSRAPTENEPVKGEGQKPSAARGPIPGLDEPVSKASDKSVRDHPMRGVRKGDDITVVMKYGPKLKFSAAEIGGLTEWDRKGLIEKQTRHWDDEPGGFGQSARLRDGVRNVLRQFVPPKKSFQDQIDANREAKSPAKPEPSPETAAKPGTVAPEPVVKTAGEFLKEANRSSERAMGMANSASGSDQADSSYYFREAKFWRDLAKGTPFDEAFAELDKGHRAETEPHNTKIEGAPKIRSGPYSGQSSRSHRWTSPEQAKTRLPHLKTIHDMIVKGRSVDPSRAAETPAPSPAEASPAVTQAAEYAEKMKRAGEWRPSANTQIEPPKATGKPQTIAQKVESSIDHLKTLDRPALVKWAKENGIDSRAAFPRFKAALAEHGINFSEMAIGREKQRAEIEKEATHEIELFVDAKASAGRNGRYAITDKDGHELWHGEFFDSTKEQSDAELEAAKKAVWMAGKIKEAAGAPAVRLKLNVDAQWMTYQDHKGQKGYALTEAALPRRIALEVNWISGKSNPADKWTVASGFKKWSDNDLASLAEPIAPAADVAGVETDPARRQEIQNSIDEGEGILKSGRTIAGRKMTPGELEVVRRSVESAKAKLGPPPAESLSTSTEKPHEPDTGKSQPIHPENDAGASRPERPLAEELRGGGDAGGKADVRQGEDRDASFRDRDAGATVRDRLGAPGGETGGERPPVGEGPGSGRSADAQDRRGQQGVGGLSESAPGAQEGAADVAAWREAAKEHVPLLQAAGYSLEERLGIGGSGIQTNTFLRTVEINPAALAEHAQTVERQGGDARLWRADTLRHEMSHVAQGAVHGVNVHVFYTGLSSAMTPEIRALYADYGGATRAEAMAVEHVAQLVQYRMTGRLAEEASGKFSAAELVRRKAVMDGPQPEAIEREAKRIQAFMESDHPTQARIAHESGEQNIFGAPHPLRAAYDKVADEITAARDELKLRGTKDALAFKTDAVTNRANYHGQQAGDSIRLDLPDKADREAMPFVIEAGGDAAKLAQFKSEIAASSDPKLAAKYGPVIDRAIAEFPRLDAKKAGHEKLMADSIAELQARNIDVGEVENYVTRKLDAPEAIKDVLPNPLFSMGGGTGRNPRYFTKGRSFETLAEAIKAGYPPLSTDLADLDAHRIEAGKRMAFQKDFFNELKATPAPTDGKPIIGKFQTRTLVNGDTEQTTPRGYSVVNAAGTPLVVHNDLAPLMRDLYGDSAMRRNAAGRAAVKLAAFVKHGTLAIDTFHIGRMLFKMATAGGGGPFTRRNGRPAFNIHRGRALLEYSDADLGRAEASGDITHKEADYARSNRPKIEKLMEFGMNVGKVADNLMEQARLHMPVVSKLNDWIFGKLSRSAMLQSSLGNLERNLNNPKYTEEQAYRQTAREMNELFGNLQNQGLFKSKTLQDIARLIFLAPNWTESQFRNEARSYGQAGKTAFNAARGRGFRVGNSTRIFAAGFVALLLVNQLINYLSRRKSTFENEEDGHKLDGWIPGGKRGFWFNPLEIAGEYAHAAFKYLAQHEHPVDVASHIASNKLSPLARGAKEGLTGRDYAGRHFLSNADRARSAITSALPVPIVFNSVFEKDPRATLGYRLTRRPGAAEKQLLQSVGAKVTEAQSQRTQMFEIAQPFRPDGGRTDTAGEYTELRRALDNDDSGSAVSEIKWLLGRGKTMDVISRAMGIRKDGSIPRELFTGGNDREAEMLKSLTSKEAHIYALAQRDHMQNAIKFQRIAATMPPTIQPRKAVSLPPLVLR